MGKNKKSRKGKLARPPKKKNAIIQSGASLALDEDHRKEVESYVGGSRGAKLSSQKRALASDSGVQASGEPVSPPLLQDDRYGLTEGLIATPNLMASKRFTDFMSHIERIKDELGVGVDRFSARNVNDLKLRGWLTRMAIRHEQSLLRPWQVSILERAGFDWAWRHYPSRNGHGAGISFNPENDRYGLTKGLVFPRSLMKSKSLVSFVANCERIKDELGDGVVRFSARDVKDEVLRKWLTRMASHYERRKLQPWQIAILKRAGFDWTWRAPVETTDFLGRPRRVGVQMHEGLLSWEELCRMLSEHFARTGELLFHQRVDEERILATWLGKQRQKLSYGKLSKDREQALLQIHPEIFTLPIRRDKYVRKRARPGWLNRYHDVQAYLRNKDLKAFPPEGLALPQDVYDWLHIQKYDDKARLLTPVQLKQLHSIGYSPDMVSKCRLMRDEFSYMDQGLERYRAFLETHGHGNVPESYHELKLVNFVAHIRKLYRMNLLSEERRRALDEAGFVFAVFEQPTPAWMAQYEKLAAYKKEKGHLHFTKYEPQYAETSEYLRQQKLRGRKGLLLSEHIRLLNELGVEWGNKKPIPKDANPSNKKKP